MYEAVYFEPLRTLTRRCNGFGVWLKRHHWTASAALSKDLYSHRSASGRIDTHSAIYTVWTNPLGHTSHWYRNLIPINLALPQDSSLTHRHVCRTQMALGLIPRPPLCLGGFPKHDGCGRQRSPTCRIGKQARRTWPSPDDSRNTAGESQW